MAIWVNPEQILSCTVGQLNNDINNDGIDTKEMMLFGEFFLKNLRQENNKDAVFIDYPTGDRSYYGDTWRNYFEYFMGKYRFNYQEIFSERVKASLKVT